MSLSSFLSRSWRGWVVLVLVLVQAAWQPVLAAVAAPSPSPAAQPASQPNFAPPQANTGLSVPSSPLLGQDVSFTVTFNNGGPNTGYGPVIDLIIPASAGLGTSASNIHVSYAGSAFTLNQDYFVTTFAGGLTTEPLIRDGTGALVTVSTSAAVFGGVVKNGDKLVTIKLPFGSFGPTQPPIVIDVTVNMAAPAAVGKTMYIWARGGFQYGADPLDNWCCGDTPSATLSTWVSQPVTPVLWTISKTYSGPENEAATGPNFRTYYPLQYSIAVDIAPSQTITNLVVTDFLPPEIQPFSWVDPVNGTGCTPSSFNIPLDQGTSIQCTFGSVTGPPSGDAKVITFDFYIPLTEPGGSSNILNPQTGASVNSCNNASVGGDWNGVSQPTLSTGTAPGSCGHTLTDKSLALQKTAAVVSSGTLKPGAIILNTLTFQVSDYFAFDNLTLLDIVSDGQHFINDSAHLPTLVINGHGYTLGAPTPVIFDPTNYSVDCYYSGPGSECTTSHPSNSGNLDQFGTTQLTFDITDEIKTATLGAQDGKLFGGCVDPANGSVDCTLPNNTGATTGIIVFYTQALHNFTDNYPSGDTSLDQGDLLSNVGKDIQGDVLNWNGSSWVPTGSQVQDDSGVTLTVPLGTLTKSVYAVNGKTVSGPVTIQPGDQVTYEIRYDLPVSNEENLRFTDYLPLPILDVTNPAADGTITSWTISTTPGVITPGTVSLGPSDTFYQYMLNDSPPSGTTGHPSPTTNPSSGPLSHDGSIQPNIVVDPTNNSLSITYPNYDDTQVSATIVDLLITATVTNEPFADLLYLTNEALSFEGSTNAGISSATKIVQVKVAEPVIVTKKSAIWVGNYINSSWAPKAGVAFSPALPSSPSILDPSNPIRWTGTIADTNYTQFNADVFHVDANDVISFMIMLVDTGHSDKGAYDLAIKDALPSSNIFEVPTAPTGLNLHIWHGDGSGADYGEGYEEIKFTGLGGAPAGFTSPGGDLFGNGISLIDPADNPYGLSPGPGDVAICQSTKVGAGKNVIVITYDLQIIPGVTPGSYTNTASNTSYASRNNGPNFVPSGGSSDTTKTVIDSVPTKYLITTSEPSTSESGTGTAANPREVTIGEIVRFRVVQTIPEGTDPGYQVHDPLPKGLTYLNDGTTTFAFISNNGPGNITTDNGAILGLSSCTYNLLVASPVVVNGTTPPSSSLCPLPPSDITNKSGGTSFPSGEEVHFLFGNLSNTHDDPDPEAVVIEFNAIVDNTVSGASQVNSDGRIITNVAYAFINGIQAGSNATAVSLKVIESKLTVNKQAAALRAQIDQNDVVTYTVTIPNLVANGSHTDAFNVHYVDTLPSTLNLQLPIVSITGGVGMTNNSAGNIVDISFTEIALGDTVTIVYQAKANGTVTPSQAIQNTGTVTWTSLPRSGPNGTIIGTSPNGTGSTVPGASGTDSSERNGSGGTANSYHASATATINVISAALSKLAPIPTTYPIGASVDYYIQVYLPEGTTPALQITDHLPAGLGYVSSQVITTVADSASSPIPLVADFNGSYTGSGTCQDGSPLAACSPGDTNQDLSFAFGDVTVTGGGTEGTSQNVFLLLVQAQVLNVIGNQHGTLLQNTASLTYTGLGTSLTSSQTITVVGPLLTLNKSAATINIHPQANDIVTYTVTISAPSGPNRSNAYNVHYTDTLPMVMKLDSTTITVNGIPTVGSSTETPLPSKIDLTISEIDISQTVTITYEAKLLVAITPSDDVTNSGEVTWTSTQVLNAQTRTGADFPNSSGLNNYFQTASVSLTSQNITAEKSIVGSSASFTPDSGGSIPSTPYPLAIGETVTYRLKMVIPQGTASAVTFQDTLPLGFSYVGSPMFSFISLYNTISSSYSSGLTDLNANHHDIPPTAAFPPSLVTVTTTAGQDTVKFDIGDLVNTDTDSSTEESVIIDFTVLVNNDLNNNAFSSNVNDYLKNNYFTVQISGSTAETSNMVYDQIVESRLSINKTVSDDHPGPGETVTYSLAIDNNTANSTTDSFDVALTDVIDTNLTLDLGSITYSFTPPVSQPSWTPSPKDTSTASQLNIGFATIPLGASVTVQYKATVNSGVTGATTILNTGNVTWTSLPGTDTHERTGTIGSTTAPNNYFATSNASLSILRALSKTVSAGNIQPDTTDPFTLSRPAVSPPALPTVYIGETLVYQIVLTLPPGDTNTMTLTDTLDRGLAFLKCESLTPESTDLTTDVSGSSSTDFSSICTNPTVSTEPSGSTNLADSGRKILFTFGDIHNANANSQTLTLVYDVIVLDNQENVNGVNGLKNDAVWTWGTGTLSAAAQGVNVQEAKLSIVKTATPQIARIGSTVSFNLHVEHTSQSAADAYDVLVTDAIPTGLAINLASVVVTAPGLPPAVVNATLNVLTMYWSHFPLGSTADVNFTAQFVGPSPVRNSSTVEWSSIQIDPRPHFVALSAYNTLSTERRYVPTSSTINDYFGSSVAEIRTPSMPNTGFAPGVQSILPVQSPDKAYDSNVGMWLEIPALNLKMSIVGVPESGGSWDVSWLGDQAGYLEGTAFPTWSGNSVLTGHVYRADGLPGPFVNLKTLSWGDLVIVHYAGQQYIYEVRTNEVISPTDASIFSHKDYPWLTLLTCKDYNAQTNSYAHRVAVGAVLVQIEADPLAGSPTTAH
ncbi:MAG: sortase [Anaerolineales bacterium]|jgi:LPXTG-site transpeptidase (sortase) family protein